MRRWMFSIAALGLLIGLLGAAPAAAAPTPTAANLTPLPTLIREYGPRIDAFWQSQFAAAGLPYHPAKAELYEKTLVSGCGRIFQVSGSFYCPADRTIYLGSLFLRKEIQPYGDFAVVQVIAHEWGHHVQEQLGAGLSSVTPTTGLGPSTTSGPPAEAVELQADCLSGTYFADRAHHQQLTSTDLDQAIMVLMDVGGDPGSIPPDARNAHGTGADRVRMFLQGYYLGHGLQGCGKLVPAG